MLLNLKTKNNYYLYHPVEKMLCNSNQITFIVQQYLKENNIDNLSSNDINHLINTYSLSEKDLLSAVERITYLENITNNYNYNSQERIINDESIIKSVANVNQIIIEITERCNLNCYYCCFGDLYENSTIRNKDMDIENCKIMLSQLLQLQESKYNISSKRTISIAFYGGEPLLNFKGIKNIVLFLKQFISDSLSFRYYMTTNGVLLNDISFFVENDFQITISIDGDINQNSFRVFADGKSSFDLVYQNILTIKNTYPEFYSNNVYLLSILHSKNDYISLYIFFQNLGKKFRASTLATEDVKPSKVNEFENIYKDGILSNDELLKIKSFYPDIFKDTEERLNPINEVLISLNQKWNIFNEIPPKVESTCFLFQSKIFLSVSGFIYPCEKVSRKLPFGTFNNGEIKYFTEKIKDYYNILTKKREATCRDCYDKDNCSQCFFVAPDMDYEKCKINENKYCCRLVEIIEFNEKSILEY